MKLGYLAARLRVKEIIISNVIPLSRENEIELACLKREDCLKKLESLKLSLIRYALETKISLKIPEFSFKSERRCPFMEKDALYITAEGYVAPCIYYAHHWTPTINGISREINPVRFGNIMESNIIDIWHEERYADFRFITKFFILPSCLDCNLEKSCQLTLSNQYDCWGNNPSCSHCPYSRNLVSCPL
jgi:MoaA/NifB/PqqE/SkfB family radical SAM enzyme